MKKKINKKFLSALFLSLLAVTGGVLATPMLDTDNQLAQIQESVKLFEKNPEKFLQTDDLGLRTGFESPNEYYMGGYYENEIKDAINEDGLTAALESEDYDKWKEILQNTEGISDTSVISQEDFDILAALHKSKKAGMTEEIDD